MLGCCCVDTSKYHPRLCHIKLWPDFQGYGFNLHAEKGKPGQFIGKVDDGSPSDAGGLREGDRIVEVNGNSVSSESHGAVVQHIKSNPNETKLLVVDTDTDRYYQEKGVDINGGLPEVETIVCPDQSSGKLAVVPYNATRLPWLPYAFSAHHGGAIRHYGEIRPRLTHTRAITASHNHMS